MSQVKALRSMLVAATDYIYHTMRDQKNGLVNAIERSDKASDEFTVGELLKWRKEHRASLRGVETVKAKVTTTVVADRKLKQDAKESAVKHRVPSRKRLLAHLVQLTPRKQRDIVRVTDRAGVRWVELEDGTEIDTRELTFNKETSIWQYNGQTVAKEKKAERRARNEEVHEIIGKAATKAGKRSMDKAKQLALDEAESEMSSGAKDARQAKGAAKARRTGKDGVKKAASKLSEISDAVDPNKKSRVPFSEKVKVEIANRVDAGQITKKLMRQAHAYVDKHQVKVEHMQELKVRPAADKVLKLTVKANAA